MILNPADISIFSTKRADISPEGGTIGITPHPPNYVRIRTRKWKRSRTANAARVVPPPVRRAGP